LGVYGIIVLTAGIVSFWLWPEMNKRQFPESLEELKKQVVLPILGLKAVLSDKQNNGNFVFYESVRL
jgi:hypothetical protein